VSHDESLLLNNLLARWQQGDEAARQELIARAYDRLRRLAAVILNADFPRLKSAPALLQTTEVANEAALGLYQMLAEVRPPTARDFFRLAAQRIRWLLLDRAKQLDRDRRHQEENAVAEGDPARREDGQPAALAALYAQIDALPDHEREVVDLLYFHGLTQEEAAELLGVTVRTVRRYWTAARVKLADGLQHLVPPPAESE
jgi:RNA polymerase sigma-70 factor (ECF subfamily)